MVIISISILCTFCVPATKQFISNIQELERQITNKNSNKNKDSNET